MENRLEDIDITREELNRFGEALKHKEFRDLLVEYCEEMTDPATRKKYEEEITQLEKDRGVDITFVNPKGEYVIKTSIDGSKLAFINICTNEHVGKPSAINTCQEGNRGHQWSLPHLLSPPRNDMNNSKKLCSVFDIMFHPDTLRLSSRSIDFRNMVNKIACEAIESNFNVVLDKANLKFPKLKYKGIARPLVIRKKTSDVNVNVNGDTEIDKLYADMYKMMDEKYENKKVEKTPSKETKKNVQTHIGYTTPKFLIKHRNDIDIQDFTYDIASKLNATVPKELIVEINLPLLKSAADIDLDVTEKTIKITSEKPAKYKLDITLPYPINEECGNAKFDLDNRKLMITLPVKRSCKLLLSDIGRYDSGVDSDSSPVADSPSDKSMPLIEELEIEDSANESQCSSVQSESEIFRTNVKAKSSGGFLKSDLHYLLPEYSCHIFNNIISFTLNVKNVNPDSIEKQYNETFTAVHTKFSSISSGYFPVYYAFYINLPSHFIDNENLSIEAWDNNVIVQIPYKPCDKTLLSYYVGVSPDTSEEKHIEEPSIINCKEIENMTTEIITESKPNVEVQLDSDDELTIVVSPEINNEYKDVDTESSSSSSNSKTECIVKPASSPQNIKCRSLSESSVDESSFSHSPGKSILKSSHRRHLVSRSVSESSIDDFTWSSSFENCAATSESLIPEETEISSSMKKTVRFNDVVSRQLFRSNSSILGQRKKNQRKSRNKKKAQERRMSESENSEPEDKKEKEKQSSQTETTTTPTTTIKNKFLKKNDSKSKESKGQADLQFHLDM